MKNELDALGTLTTIPQLGSVRIRLLIQYFGSAFEALNASSEEVAQLPDFGEKVATIWRNDRWKKTWELNRDLAERQRAAIIPYTSDLYPKRLLELADHPLILYVKGRLSIEDQQGIAVIGTRQATIYGMEMAEKISQDLAAAKCPVISGLARGIDTAAHRGALRKGRTVAVIGSGLADIYPRENLDLSKEISEKGALISEFPMATPPDRQNFPQRNRIVSCLSMGTLLIEAPLKSGAMITVERARSQKRRLFALPGRADIKSFEGNHHIIKTGQAQLIENANDILSAFEDLFGLRTGTPSIDRLLPPLAREELDFLSLLPYNELGIDEMVQITKLPVIRINIMVMSLVLKGAVREFPGRVYKKVRHNG